MEHMALNHLHSEGGQRRRFNNRTQFFFVLFFKSSQITLSEKEIHLFKTFICCIRLKHHCLVLKLHSTEATSLALGPYYLFMWLWHWQQKHCMTKTFHLKYVNRKKEIKAWIKGTKAFLSKKNCNFLRQQKPSIRRILSCSCISLCHILWQVTKC